MIFNKMVREIHEDERFGYVHIQSEIVLMIRIKNGNPLNR